MPSAYSYDLRTKVIEAIDGGMGKTQVSRIFKLSRNTINLWLKRREETGDYEAKKGYQQGYSPKIANLEEFKKFVRLHGSKTQEEMAQVWQGEISRPTIGKALQKINFSRKKNLRISRKR